MLPQFATPKLTLENRKALVSGKDFEIVFDRDSGALQSWRFKGTELIRSALRPDFWRAQIDNDRGRKMEDRKAFGAPPTKAERASVAAPSPRLQARGGHRHLDRIVAERESSMGDGLHDLRKRRCRREGKL